ncbi:MAG: hypothetical protein LUD29_05995 [Clostridia bacterium]|nr:hypothetical protein [Clostridia bacterium]
MRARKERSYLPAVIIEHKTKKSTKTAMNQITEKGYDDYFEYRGYHGDVIHVGLNFKKMTEKKKASLAKKSAGPVDDGGKHSFGNDAGLGTHTDIVHFCELKKYKI